MIALSDEHDTRLLEVEGGEDLLVAGLRRCAG
jgi:hypothetical protein